MKKVKLITQLMAITILFVLASCRDNNEDPAVEPSDAAEDIGATLSSDLSSIIGDFDVLTEDASADRVSDGRIQGCGVSYDTTFTHEYNGTYVTGQSTITYGYELVCNGSIPSSLNLTVSSSGSRSSQRFTGSGSLTGTAVVTGILPASSPYMMNATLTRTASVQGPQRSFNSTSNLVLENVNIAKTTQQVTSGTATLTYSATSSEGNSVSYTATVEFLGEGTAELTLNGLHKFLVNIRTGEVTKTE